MEMKLLSAVEQTKYPLDAFLFLANSIFFVGGTGGEELAQPFVGCACLLEDVKVNCHGLGLQ